MDWPMVVTSVGTAVALAVPSILSFAGGVSTMLLAEWFKPWNEERKIKKRVMKEMVAVAADLTYVAYNDGTTFSDQPYKFSYLKNLQKFHPELLSRIDVHDHYQQIVNVFAKAHPDLKGTQAPIDQGKAKEALRIFYLYMEMPKGKRGAQKIEGQVLKQAERQRAIFGTPQAEFPSITGRTQKKWLSIIRQKLSARAIRRCPSHGTKILNFFGYKRMRTAFIIRFNIFRKSHRAARR
jgi:hypothetical protein